MPERIAYLSDIHANAHAFSAALELLDQSRIDTLVILGDLLTYGCESGRTLEILHEAQERWKVTLIAGNHDQLYFNLPNRDADYINHLPEWIRESVLWTKAQISRKQINNLELTWKEEYQRGEWFAAHANPKGFGNWEYLESDTAMREAILLLQNKKAKVGIFGHSHRPKIISQQKDDSFKDEGKQCVFDKGFPELNALLVNTGSIGQPRSRSRKPTALLVDHFPEARVKLELCEFDYDMDAHIAGIEASPLSMKTKAILKSFFED